MKDDAQSAVNHTKNPTNYPESFLANHGITNHIIPNCLENPHILNCLNTPHILNCLKNPLILNLNWLAHLIRLQCALIFTNHFILN
jgi:hypothetical protein